MRLNARASSTGQSGRYGFAQEKSAGAGRSVGGSGVLGGDGKCRADARAGIHDVQAGADHRAVRGERRHRVLQPQPAGAGLQHEPALQGRAQRPGQDHRHRRLVRVADDHPGSRHLRPVLRPSGAAVVQDHPAGRPGPAVRSAPTRRWRTGASRPRSTSSTPTRWRRAPTSSSSRPRWPRPRASTGLPEIDDRRELRRSTTTWADVITPELRRDRGDVPERPLDPRPAQRVSERGGAQRDRARLLG